MRARFVPLVLIGALVLAGCGGSGSHGHASPTGLRPTVTTPAPTTPAPADPSTTLARSGPPAPVAPTVPADVPTTGPNLRSPGEEPPVMPLEATQHTPAGAVAFAKFFIQTIDWGYATTSSAYMDHYFTPACAACRTFSKALSSAHTQNERFQGGHLTIRSTRSVIWQNDGATSDVQVVVDITTFARLDANGRYLDGEAAQRGIAFRVSAGWGNSRWTVTNLRATT